MIQQQYKITQPGPLLNERGELIEKGYSTSLLKTYNRNDIKACGFRIKEWDNYIIYNNKIGIAITIDDNSYMGLNSITLFDFDNKNEITKSYMYPFTFGSVKLPFTTKVGDIKIKARSYEINILNDGKVRNINLYVKKFKDGCDLKVDFTLYEQPEDSLVIAIPFPEDKKAFYYNHKILGFKIKGDAYLGNTKLDFDNETTRGILDWGRGVWTYHNIWYWGAAVGKVNNIEIGFNIGYGFGDTNSASENVIFVNGKAHKLDQIKIDIPVKEGKEDYMSKWKVSSNNGRFGMDFFPILDKSSFSSAIIISSDQHQVFGKFTGKMILDDGKVIKIKEFLGFIEKFKNYW